MKVLKKIFDKIFSMTVLWVVALCTAFAGCFMAFLAGLTGRPDPKPEQEVVSEQDVKEEPVEAASTSEEA